MRAGDGHAASDEKQNTRYAEADSRNSLVIEWTSYKRGCAERKVGNPLHDAASIGFVDPPGTFAENLSTQAAELANLVAPVCAQREPFAGLDINNIYGYALRNGPDAVHQLTEATNRILSNGSSGVQLSSRYSTKQEEYLRFVQPDGYGSRQAIGSATVDVGIADITIRRAGQVEYERQLTHVPESVQGKDWMKKTIFEALRGVRG